MSSFLQPLCTRFADVLVLFLDCFQPVLKLAGRSVMYGARKVRNCNRLLMNAPVITTTTVVACRAYSRSRQSCNETKPRKGSVTVVPQPAQVPWSCCLSVFREDGVFELTSDARLDSLARNSPVDTTVLS